MTDEADHDSGPSENSGSSHEAPKVDVPSGSGPELDRLPPPVFPPGSRRSARVRSSRPRTGEPRANDELDDAFISPDDPIRSERKEFPEDAFISPDDPIRSDEESAEGVVTGIGDQSYTRAVHHTQVETNSAANGLADTLEVLARGLRREGSSALNLTEELSRFEATLRGFLAGYLSGRED